MIRRLLELLAGLGALLVAAVICLLVFLAGCVAPGPGEPSLVDAIAGPEAIVWPDGMDRAGYVTSTSLVWSGAGAMHLCPEELHPACGHPLVRLETRTVCARCGATLHGQEKTTAPRRGCEGGQ